MRSDEIEGWRRLLSPDGHAIRERARAAAGGDLGALDRLRAEAGDLAGVALQWARGASKAAEKFPGRSVVADATGVEQASSPAVARHKARRFAEAGATFIADLCCGVGGDAMALREVARVIAVDRWVLRAWMCARNAGCPAACADVTTLARCGEFAHLDPDRRFDAASPGARRRARDLADYLPPPAEWGGILRSARGAAIKLGPGVRREEIPGVEEAELEFLSEGGRLVQAVLWTGILARRPGLVAASRVETGAHAFGTPAPPPPGDGEPGRYLIQADPALERAGLWSAVLPEARELWPGLGILTADEPPPATWCRAYAVLSCMPWREKRLRAWIRDHDVGEVVVKTRGGAEDPERAARTLRGHGSRAVVLFALRLDRRKVGVFAEPVEGRCG